jgi:ABC-2 type transport system ATP-binding protein
VLWIRHLLTGLAAEGRTVLVSSHLMGEMAQTATNLVIVGGGRLLADTTVARFLRDTGSDSVTVTSAEPGRLRDLLAGPGVTVSGAAGSETLQVTGLTARQVGQRAADLGIAVYELSTHSESLEEAFMALTGDSVEYHGRRAA